MNIYENKRDIKEQAVTGGQLYIYVMENYPQGNIKIGRTTNPIVRFKSLSGSNNGGNSIKRIAISPITYLYSLEKICHSHFHKNNIPNTEYFRGISFEEAVEYVDSLFANASYESSNNARKNFYESNPKMIPKFLVNDSKNTTGNSDSDCLFNDNNE